MNQKLEVGEWRSLASHYTLTTGTCLAADTLKARKYTQNTSVTLLIVSVINVVQRRS